VPGGGTGTRIRMTPELASSTKDRGDGGDALRDLPADEACALFAATLAGEVPAAQFHATLAALAGEQPLPAPIVAQLGCCLNGAHRAAAGAENRGNP